jgi:putative transposase
MYDYRQLSPDERTVAVAYRRSRGFPLHKPPHSPAALDWYLVTAATFEHCSHFSAPRELTALECRLLEAVRGTGSACAGWVVLPNHYHLLVQCENIPDLGRALGRVHGRSSRYANRRDGAPGRRVWYKYTDRRMRSDRHFWATLHYLISNPVKHGFVSDMRDWAWSCLHELDAEYGPEWVESLCLGYPVRDYGIGWDD